MAYIGQLILLVVLIQSTLGMDEEGLKLLNTSESCLCPGESLTYECTVMGEPGGSTVWQGSAFNCTNHEISLFHSLYETTEGDYGECDDTVGQSVRNTTNSDNNSTTYYVSQLTVPISSGTEGRTIECLYDNGETSTSVGKANIHITIAPSRALERLYMSNADFALRQLTFSWSPVVSDCPAIHYNILASNCGSCPTTTNRTNVICTDVPTDRSDGTTCMFAIQTMVCGIITGNVNDPIIINTTFHHNIMGTDSLSTDTAYIVSIGLLATALIVCTAVFLIVIIVTSFRNRARNKAATGLHLVKKNRTQPDSMYEDVTTPSLPVGAIKTQDNVAYGHNDCS